MSDRNQFLEDLAWNYRDWTNKAESAADGSSELSKKYHLDLEIVEHPIFMKVASELARLHSNWITQGLCGGLAIVGQAGVGKTTLEKWYEQRVPSERLADRDSVPILRVTTPETPHGTAVASAMALRLGMKLPKSDDKTEKHEWLQRQLCAFGVEMVFLSEFQHLYDHRPGDTNRFTDWLKIFDDKFDRPLVITCMPRGALSIEANSQLRRRFTRLVELEPFSIATKDSLAILRSFLKTVHARVRIDAIPFHDKQTAVRFYYASNGCADFIVKSVRRALDICRLEESVIDLPVLAKAFKAMWPRVSDDLNPFSSTFEKLRSLTGPKEPFETWDKAWP